jgi:hypothetical protein
MYVLEPEASTHYLGPGGACPKAIATFYKAVVLSVLLYSFELWVLYCPLHAEQVTKTFIDVTPGTLQTSILGKFQTDHELGHRPLVLSNHRDYGQSESTFDAFRDLPIRLPAMPDILSLSYYSHRLPVMPDILL